MKTINVKSGITYLSEVINELPKNCLFDKGATGCGGTTLAIESNEDYVICVPFVSLVNNKVSQHKNLFAVKEGVTKTAITKYINNAEPIKIIVTYDSLHKVVEALGNRVNSVNLLVDEMHLLFTQYTFRKEAVKSVLDLYKSFGSYCFMTATVIKDKYLLKELKDMPKVVCEWENIIETSVTSVKCENVEATVVNMINQVKNIHTNENFYFFVNSIEFINEVVKATGINDDNARMICSQNNVRDKKLKISDTLSEPKKINFITSTAFEGADLYDENGRIIIISDGTKAHTLTDISTSLLQIAGRIRNSQYNGKIMHLFSKTRYTDITVEEHQERSESEIKDANRLVKEMTEFVASKAKGDGFNNQYIFKNEITGLFEFDENAVLIDMWNFEINHGVYSFRNRLNEEYKAKGLNIIECDSFDEKVKAIRDVTADTKDFKFSDYVKTIKELSSKDGSDFDIYLSTLKEAAFTKYTFLKEAIEKVGFGKMGTLKYNQRAIKAELINQSDFNESSKVVKISKLLNIKSGEFISSAELKDKINSIYSSLDIKKSAKAGDITEWFEVKETVRKIEKRSVKGYSIIRSKVIFNQ